jgi:hypothetical protein
MRMRGRRKSFGMAEAKRNKMLFERWREWKAQGLPVGARMGPKE